MAKFNLKGKGKRGKRPLEGSKVYIAIQGKPKFHVDQSINNFGQNISFRLLKKAMPILYLDTWIDLIHPQRKLRCYSIKRETKTAKLKIKDGK